MNNKRYATPQESNDFFKGFLNTLQLLVDVENQNKAWVHGDYKDYHLDFIDIYNAFMSPCEVIISWQSLSNHQREELETLYKMLLSYQDTKLINEKEIAKSNTEIALDPEWHKIRNFAKKVYHNLSLIGEN